MPRTLLLALAFLSAAPGWSQTPTPEVSRSLRGVVEGAKGQPVRVTVWRNDMRRSTVDPLCDGKTAADGSFAFTEVPWLKGFDWGFNTMVAVARVGDRVGLLEIRGDSVALDELVVKLGDAIDLRGVIRDEDGRPIAGARVWPSIFGEVAGDSRPEAWVTSPLLPWCVNTDAEGRFTLKGLPAIAPIRLLAEHTDYAREWIKVHDFTESCDGELQLGGKISGTVTMPDGKPAVRVKVYADGRVGGHGRATTDENGRFCLTGLQEDLYKIWAETSDLTVIAVADLNVVPGETIKGQQIRFVEGGFIVGRIVDAATGEPVKPGPHTDVAMYGPARPNGGACQCTPVLPDGTFRIRAPAGVNRIYLRASPGWSEPSEDVDVVEGKETKVVWRVRVHT